MKDTDERLRENEMACLICCFFKTSIGNSGDTVSYTILFEWLLRKKSLTQKKFTDMGPTSLFSSAFLSIKCQPARLGGWKNGYLEFVSFLLRLGFRPLTNHCENGFSIKKV